MVADVNSLLISTMKVASSPNGRGHGEERGLLSENVAI
jgi:hypothetical protein